MKDELFLRGENVPMTKEAVRALALSKLELHRASHLIDVGAGTGSVSIEAALQFPSLQVTAIERNPAALRLLDENRQRFACGNIDILPRRSANDHNRESRCGVYGRQRRSSDGAD